MTRLRDEGLDDVLVIVGGIVPDEDVGELIASGVAEVFHPGASLAEVVRFIEDRVWEKRNAMLAKVVNG